MSGSHSNPYVWNSSLTPSTFFAQPLLEPSNPLYFWQCTFEWIIFCKYPTCSIMSISPDIGHPPYSVVLDGSIHIAGHVPFPLGNFALISNLPYRKSAFPFVLIRADVYISFPNSSCSFLSSIVSLPSFTQAFPLSVY